MPKRAVHIAMMVTLYFSLFYKFKAAQLVVFLFKRRLLFKLLLDRDGWWDRLVEMG